jgi:magnesium-transporting ATPase (P-type)
LFGGAQVILYSFYKNIVLTMILFYFSFFTGFSGQSLYDDWVYAGYAHHLPGPCMSEQEAPTASSFSRKF